MHHRHGRCEANQVRTFFAVRFSISTIRRVLTWWWLGNGMPTLRPHVLIGTSTTADSKAKTFTKEVVQEMANINEKPVVFALSGRHSVSSAVRATDPNHPA